MGLKQYKTWLIVYLSISFSVFSIAQELPISEAEIEEMARGYIADFEKEIDTAVQNAPEDPDNDIDNEDRPRLFFLFALLPKIALILAKIAIKAVPLIIKAVAVVKAKVVATAAVTAAKFATGAAIKKTLITGAVKLAKFAVETIVVDSVVDAVTNAVAPKAAEAEEVPVTATPGSNEPKEPKPANIYDYYDNDEICDCTSKKECGCCVTPKDKLQGCFNITLEKPLWDVSSTIKVGAFYGGKNIMTRTLPVKKPRQRCLNLQAPFDTTKMCVATFGRTIVGKRITQCFSLHFNQRGMTKCLVQNKGNKVWFKSQV